MSNGGAANLASGFKWVALGKLSTQLITWGMTFFVLRLLDPSDYGVVALSSAITLLFGMIAEFGFSSAIVQAKTINRTQLSNLFGYGILINAAIVILLVAFAPLVTHIYSDERLPSVIRIASLQFVFAAFAMLPEAKLRREMQFKLMAKLEFVIGVFAGLCTLVLAYLGFGYWSLVISPLAAAFLRMILLNVSAKEWVPPKLSFDQTQALLKFGGLTLMARIAGHFLSQADVLIAGAFLSKEALGAYAVAMQLAAMPLSKVMMVINQVAYPELSRMNRDGGVRPEVLLVGGRMIAYIIFPVLWGLAAVAPFVVHLLMGDKWSAAILPLQLVCLALPFRAISTLLATSVAAVGRADVEFWNTLSGCIIFPVLFYFLVQYGVVGLAWAWVIGTPLFVFVNLNRSGPILGIRTREVASALWPPAACAGLMYCAIAALLHFGFFESSRLDHLVYSITIGVATYIAVFACMDMKALRLFAKHVGVKI